MTVRPPIAKRFRRGAGNFLSGWSVLANQRWYATIGAMTDDRWKRIRVLFLDSDGVLTEGGVYVDEEGRELRRFSIKDGYGIAKLLRSGVEVAVISRSPAEPVVARARRLGISRIHTGEKDKVARAEAILAELGYSWAEAAFMGDDIPDLPLLGKVGLALAPADAVSTVRAAAHWVASAPGGRGAIREVADLMVPEE